MAISEILGPVGSLRILVLIFLAILFLQSALDKIFDYKGNLEWLTGHFANSPLGGTVGLLLPVLTILELASGAVCLSGVVYMLICGTTWLGLIGAQLCAVSIIALFFGQRVAKDYPGAATLTTYFLISMAAIYLFQIPLSAG